MQASIAAQMPNACAQMPRSDGNQNCTTTEAITMATECATEMRTMARASCQVGGGGEPGSCSSDAGVGKKMRNRNKL